MAVGSVLLLALGTVLTGTLRGSVTATERVTSSAELRTALDTMARRLRVAVLPIGQPRPSPSRRPPPSSFYANLVPAGSTGCPAVAPATGTVTCPPVRVDYTVTAGCLWETRTTPTGSAAADWSWDHRQRRGPGEDLPGAARRWTSARRSSPTTRPATSRPRPWPLPVADLAGVQSVAIDLALRARSSAPVSRAGTRLTLVNLLPTP